MVPATGNSLAFLTAADAWYRSAPGRLNEVLRIPHSSEVPRQMMTSCDLAVPPGASLETLFTPRLLAAAENRLEGMAPWDCYVRENSLPTTSVPKRDDVPTLMLLAENDTLVDTATERAALQKLCAQGHRIEYLECAGATHTQPLAWALDTWLDFLEARLAGTPMPASTCQVKPAVPCESRP
jgi:acetyl esterase/lipase